MELDGSGGTCSPRKPTPTHPRPLFRFLATMTPVTGRDSAGLVGTAVHCRMPEQGPTGDGPGTGTGQTPSTRHGTQPGSWNRLQGVCRWRFQPSQPVVAVQLTMIN